MRGEEPRREGEASRRGEPMRGECEPSEACRCCGLQEDVGDRAR